MKTYYFFLLIILSGCASKKIINFDYVNKNTDIIQIDSEEYSDLSYKISLPTKPKKIITTTGIGFQKKFYFNKNQIISTIFVPNKKVKYFDNQYNCSYSIFTKILEDNKLENFFSDVKLINNRKYSVIRLSDNFLIVGLNIKENGENKYLKSIKSLEIGNVPN